MKAGKSFEGKEGKLIFILIMILKKMKFSILSTLSAQHDSAPFIHFVMEQWRVMQEDTGATWPAWTTQQISARSGLWNETLS